MSRTPGGATTRGLWLAQLGVLALLGAQLVMALGDVKLTLAGAPDARASLAWWGWLAAALSIGAGWLVALGSAIALPARDDDAPGFLRGLAAGALMALATLALAWVLARGGGRHWWGLGGAGGLTHLGPAALVGGAAALALMIMQRADRQDDLGLLEQARDVSGLLLLQVVLEALCGAIFGGAPAAGSIPRATASMLGLVIGLAIGAYALFTWWRLLALLRLATWTPPR